MRTPNEIRPSLPAHWYFDPEHYAHELAAIWYRDWVCVGRLETLQRDGDYFVRKVGTQSVVVTRKTDGNLSAFHNTCRHRGSQLCRDSSGRFRNGRVICPYHTWTYALDGQLLATPGRFETDDFDATEYSLYAVHVDTWRGFIFINLDETPATSLEEQMGGEANNLANWPLENMRSVHQEKVSLACNWKIFWENYSECYHCPRVHPELCKVMPVYKQGVFDDRDVPGWEPKFDGDSGLGTVGDGAHTWTLSGDLALPVIEGLTEAEVANGVAFSSFTGSMFVVAHPDYVRSVCIVPTGPESIELTVDWLLPSGFKVKDQQQIDAILELARRVIRQDGEVCELNQRGLRSKAHQAGVLMPQEYELWNFHEFIRRRLNAVESAVNVSKDRSSSTP